MKSPGLRSTGTYTAGIKWAASWQMAQLDGEPGAEDFEGAELELFCCWQQLGIGVPIKGTIPRV
jgi:hypothetical protein